MEYKKYMPRYNLTGILRVFEDACRILRREGKSGAFQSRQGHQTMERSPHSSTAAAVYITAFDVVRHKTNINLVVRRIKFIIILIIIMYWITIPNSIAGPLLIFHWAGDVSNDSAVKSHEYINVNVKYEAGINYIHKRQAEGIAGWIDEDHA